MSGALRYPTEAALWADLVRKRAQAAPLHSRDVEEQAQRALILWVDRIALPQEPRLEWLYHIPNGGARSKATAGRLKAMGVRAGVPDLYLAVAARGYHGSYLELKAPGAGPSPAQQHWLQGLARQGYHTGLYTGWVAAAQHLCWYLEREDLSRTLQDGGTL